MTITAKEVELPFAIQIDPEPVEESHEATIEKTIEEELGDQSSISLIEPDAAKSYEIISGLDSKFMTFDSESG